MVFGTPGAQGASDIELMGVEDCKLFARFRKDCECGRDKNRECLCLATENMRSKPLVEGILSNHRLRCKVG